MDPSDSSQNRRRIPAVSDVVAELSKRLLASPDQQPSLFHAAQQVCSEELRLVKTGFRPAPFEELVERAIRLLPSEIAREEVPRWSEANAFPETEPVREAVPRVPAPPEEGPFAFESYESLEPPRAVSEPVQPLEIPETPVLPASPGITPYRQAHRATFGERLGGSISATRVLIFLGLFGAGVAAYQISRMGGWPFRRIEAPSALRPNASPGISGRQKATPAAPPGSASTSNPPPPTVERPATPIPATAKTAPVLPDVNAAPALPESRGSSMISSDWDGRTPVYMIHFSSYQKRENAERDRARLSKLVGQPFHIISVNLGREGAWFRVMLGDFSTRDDALAFRQQLADRETPGMGLVYKVSGTR